MALLPVHFHLKTANTALNPTLLADLKVPQLADGFEERLAYERLLEMVVRLNGNALTVDTTEVQGEAPGLNYPLDLHIDVVLLPWEWRDAISPLFFSAGGEPPLGFHAQTTGQELMGEGHYNPRHQVVVFVPNDQDLEALLDHALKESGLVDFEDAERLFYNTLPHEISHVLLFAEASGGMSSHSIDVAFHAGAFPFDRHVVSTGRALQRLANHYKACFTEADEADAMEEWVETQGYALLETLSTLAPAKPPGIHPKP